MNQQVTETANSPGVLRHFVHLQPVIAVLTGLVTIAGAAYSAVKYLGPTRDTGQIVAVVQEAKSGQPVADATIEILTPGDALIATLKPDSAGRLSYSLKEGTYGVRVSHKGYATVIKEVQVTPGRRVETTVQLRSGGSTGSPLKQIGGAVKKIFR
ncbi:MAG: carboxypeptidase-like regulatory domain-containing protein [Bacteroidales bacterium]